jgi:hypothetical protein
MNLIVGSTIPLRTSLYSRDPQDGGALVNALTATVIVTKPDGTTESVSVVNPPALIGKYTADYGPTLMVGRYLATWTFTFAGGFVSKYTQAYDVTSEDPGLLISLNEAKKHLRIPDTMTTSDDQIIDFIAASVRTVEFYVGPCLPRTVVEYIDGATRVFALKTTPVLSVTSIVPYQHAGSSFTGSDVIVDSDGVVRIINPSKVFGYGYYEVTYIAGRTVVSANITQAIKIILGHMWETQRGASGLPYQNQPPTSPVAGMGYTLPNRALELLKADDLGPSVG